MNGAWGASSNGTDGGAGTSSWFNWGSSNAAAAERQPKPPKPPNAARSLLPESVPINLASYRRLRTVQEKQLAAREAKDEREERRQFAEMLKNAQKARGQALRDQAKIQHRKNRATINGRREENYRRGESIRREREEGKVQVDHAQEAWRQHGKQLNAEFAQFEVRKRAAIEAHRRKILEETIALRTDLKSQKDAVDATNLAINRARVARVRADTSDEKIRLAKSQFIDARWDQADRLRQEVEAWKAAKKNNQLEYLATAMQTNHELKMADEEAKRLMYEKREQSAAEVRQEREVLAERHREREAFEDERVKQTHDSMLGPKVVLTDAPTEHGAPGGSAIELFGRLFGFRKPANSTALIAYRGTTPRSHLVSPGDTPRSSRGGGRGGSNPFNGSVRV